MRHPAAAQRSHWSQRRGLKGASEQLARERTDAYITDTNALGLGRPDHEPLASATIGPIIGLIEDLVASGHAYAVDGDVYFSVSSYPPYGEISHQRVSEMDQGEGVEGLLEYTARAVMTTRSKRAYRGRPAREETDVSFVTEGQRDEILIHSIASVAKPLLLMEVVEP